MKPILSTLALGALLALPFAAIAAGDATDPAIGTWKLNVEKSKNDKMPKSETRTYAAADGGVKLSWKRVGADGKHSAVETTYKYDGKDYPITGSSDFDSVSLKRVGSHKAEATQKLNGKVVGTTKRTVSKDGKTLTLVSKSTNANGESTTSTMVYDRQ
jgi:hypothetical protein